MHNLYRIHCLNVVEGNTRRFFLRLKGNSELHSASKIQGFRNVKAGGIYRVIFEAYIIIKLNTT
jgi:hypothetical protein